MAIRRSQVDAIEQLLAKIPHPALVLETTNLQRIAWKLFSDGLNVFPQVFASKRGYPWQRLQYTKLNRTFIYLLFAGRCNLAVMMGKTSGNLFVIDCETKKAFSKMRSKLRKAGIPVYASRSGGRRGGGHFYLRSKDGEVANAKAKPGQEFEIRGNRCYVLAPPSTHPDGKYYSWEHDPGVATIPEVSLDQLDWLDLKLAVDNRKTTRLHPASYLSSNTIQFLHHGAPEGDRNNQLFKAACDMHGNRWDIGIATEQLLQAALACGLPENEARATIESAFSKTRTPSRQFSAQSASLPPRHDRAIAWAMQQKWPGRAGQTDREVFLACCHRATKANDNGVFRASSREIAGLARINKETASVSLRRLVKKGHIQRCGSDRSSGANLYRLPEKVFKVFEAKKRGNPDTTYLPVVGLDSVRLTPENDAPEYRALGKTAYHLYWVMMGCSKPERAKKLAALSNLSVGQVYRATKKLRRFNLAEKVLGKEGGYRAIPATRQQLDERVSIPAKTLGKGAHRVRVHEEDRFWHALEPMVDVRERDDYPALKTASSALLNLLARYDARDPILMALLAYFEGKLDEYIDSLEDEPEEMCDVFLESTVSSESDTDKDDNESTGEGTDMGLIDKVEAVSEEPAKVPDQWICDECGQTKLSFGDPEPPTTCDYCQKEVTWSPIYR